ncbi:type VII toxin-antitoxin system MntA family adenylyltransferase antitoxin [Desulfurispira natronophila]|uniref:Putative nucleotidyltransferase n=1 Tax=Desulfurispira natronophila TaxID=682562 RepID=A0A7W7Y682_9BACT|nr:nucleotidyltransferase domain-containing protein [Desulfurispira natronophila]MBB5022865.1 putative nucleotidyltransferase [Desulfurispira natronophila]
MDLCSQIANMLRGEQGLELAIIYGSVAAGTMHPGSDIDLALLFDQPLSAERKMEITARLERKVLRTVDIIDLSSISGTILKHVLCKGKILIQNEEGLFTLLAKKMIYNQTDMMPYVNRTLLERQRRFIDG